jgi:hypothetical protein
MCGVRHHSQVYKKHCVGIHHCIGVTSVCNVTAQIPRPDEKQVVVSFDLYERGQPKVANLQINMMFCFANNRVIVLRRRWTILSLLSTSVASKSIVEGTSINLELERRDETKARIAVRSY